MPLVLISCIDNRAEKWCLSLKFVERVCLIRDMKASLLSKLCPVGHIETHN